jgi:hypothetical protein
MVNNESAGILQDIIREVDWRMPVSFETLTIDYSPLTKKTLAKPEISFYLFYLN